MNDHELILQLRWLCDLADAMQLTGIPVAAVRELVVRAEGAVLVDMNTWKETHGIRT